MTKAVARARHGAPVVDAETLVEQSRTRRLSYAEREGLLRDGLAWIDKDGQWHLGQPDEDALAEAFDKHSSTTAVRTALSNANAAAREVGRLVAELQAAEAAYAAAHRRTQIAVVAEWSRANDAPHAAAHAQRVKDWFENCGDQ